MDRNTITGLVLIFLVMLAWGYFSMPSEQELAQRAEQARQDSIAALESDSAMQNNNQTDTPADTTSTQTITEQEEEPAAVPPGSIFAQASASDTSKVVIQTPLFKTTFTNAGAGPLSFTLLKHETWDQQPIQMITDTTKSAYTLGFLTNENYNIETKTLLFEQISPQNSIRLQEDETAQLQYALNISPDQRIIYTYTFYGDSYSIDLDITFQGLERTIIGSVVDFGWVSELVFTEKMVQRDATSASAYVYTGGEMLQLKMSESGTEEKSYNGTINWVSSRTQFFTQIIKSDSPTEGALLIGERTNGAERAGVNHHYETYLRAPIPDNGTIEFGLYMGPLALQTLNDFAESSYSMVDVGYAWTSWFSEPLVRWIILPFFDLMSGFMNVGLAIIVFAIAIKIVLYPLTKKSFKSMAAMKDLQPEMKKIQEKYKDDPQKQQKETMKLYKKAKVNPIGGCLPMLMQFPILITLWVFFQNSILIRQESFLWADDLSAPDYIINLPFEIPFIGDQLAGFVLLMSIAMVFQSRLTGGMSGAAGGGSAGPMKMLQYIFPVMMLFIFNNFAAGLSLYYLVYNVVSIVQQLLINKQMEEEKTVEKAVAA